MVFFCKIILGAWCGVEAKNGALINQRKERSTGKLSCLLKVDARETAGGRPQKQTVALRTREGTTREKRKKSRPE